MQSTTDSNPRPVATPERTKDLRGSTADLPASDLFQVLEGGRRSAIVEMVAEDASATLWIRSGRLSDAICSNGRRGARAFFEVIEWSDASFRVRFTTVDRPIRVAGTLSGLLLEAARRRDESSRPREAPPPHAALSDPPPSPPRDARIAHRALTLLNIASADASSVAEPPYLAKVFEQSRRSLEGTFPALGRFRVGSTGQISLEGDVSEEAVEATVHWLDAARARLHESFPGRFPRARLSRLTEAVRDDLAELGFLEVLETLDRSDSTEA